MNKYLKNRYDEIGSLKQDYKKWAFQLHPDVAHNDGEEMKVLNAEYEKMVKLTPKKEAFAREQSKPQENREYKKYEYYAVDKEFIDIIDALIKLHMKDVDCEIVQWFIWLSGNTKPYKEDLKKAGFCYHSVKKTWYKKPDFYKKVDKRIMPMDDIRALYGSHRVDIDDGIKQI